MSFADRLKFWKKEDIPDFPQPEPEQQPSTLPGMPSLPEHSFPAFDQHPFQSQQQTVQTPSVEQQVQLISAKLDTVKAQLETVLQRLDSMNRKEVPEVRPYQERWRNI